MEIREWITGRYYVRIISADPQVILNDLSENRITVQKVHWVDEMTFEIILPAQGRNILRHLCNKGLCEIHILETYGLPEYKRKLISRSVLCIGIILYLCLTIYLQNHILFIHVFGNSRVRTESIIEQVGSSGLFFGCSRKELRSEQIKNRLLESIPDLQWVGINTKGCVATIYVKERVLTKDEVSEYAQLSSIVASRDGTIRSIISLRGTAMCKVGQYVTAGQTLISGIKNCRDLLVFTSAEGEVIADTKHAYTIITPINAVKRENNIRSDRTYGISFGKKLINFNNSSGILNATCVKIVNRNDLVLPGGFTMPVSLYCTSVDYYDVDPDVDDDNRAWLLDQCKVYACKQMISGEIVSEIVLPFSFEDVTGYRVYYDCREMIGQIKKEELLDIHG